MTREEKKAQSRGLVYKTTEGAPTVKETEGSLPIITVKFSAFGNLDANDDIMLQGSFAKSIAAMGEGKHVKFLNQHKSGEVIGKVMRVWEDEAGAYAEIEMTDPEVSPKAKEVLWQLKHGHLSEFSFGFKYDWDVCRWSDTQDYVLMVGGVDLNEVSVVTSPANDSTAFLGVKSLIARLSEREIRELKEALGVPVERKERSIFETLRG